VAQAGLGGAKGRESPFSKRHDRLRCCIQHGKLAGHLRWFAGEIHPTPLLRGRPLTLASKVRAHPQAQESPATSSRRGGFAARNSTQPDSASPCPPMIKSSSSSPESRRQSDSSNPETSVKKSSSRWADRPVPVLQVEFPEPWSIIARAASAGAENGNSEKNPKWSRLASVIRSWFINQYAVG